MQEQIDRICTEVLGWHKARELWNHGICTPSGVEKLATDTVEFWADKEGRRVAGLDFNPFTNPSDCKVVMDEVAKREYHYAVAYNGVKRRWEAHMAKIGRNYIKGPDCAGVWSDHRPKGTSQTSESEAKMNALLEALGRG